MQSQYARRVDGPIEYRFWAKLNKNGPPHPDYDEPCWVWGSGCYGVLVVGRCGKKKVYAHRYSWEIHNGEIPDGLCVLHGCDNPGCCNPSHLFLGTRKDNNEDRHAKGRSGDHRGSLNGRVKLTEKDVRQIKRLYPSVKGQGKGGYRYLARRFGVSPAAIRFIIIGRNWSHVE